MKVSMHQPNLFPWLGLWHKAQHADMHIVCVLDDFSRRNYHHRARTERGWLTIPVEDAGRHGRPIRDTKIAGRGWDRKIVSSARSIYGEPLASDVARLLSPYSGSTWLIDVTLAAHEWTRLAVGSTVPIAVDADLVGSDVLRADLDAADKIIALCRAAGADVYVSGRGATKYLDVGRLAEAGITVEWQTWSPGRPYCALDWLAGNAPDDDDWRARPL